MRNGRVTAIVTVANRVRRHSPSQLPDCAKKRWCFSGVLIYLNMYVCLEPVVRIRFYGVIGFVFLSNFIRQSCVFFLKILITFCAPRFHPLFFCIRASKTKKFNSVMPLSFYEIKKQRLIYISKDKKIDKYSSYQKLQTKK